MKTQNYYLRVIKRKKEMKQDPTLKAWLHSKKLTVAKNLDCAIDALIQGKSSFDERL